MREGIPVLFDDPAKKRLSMILQRYIDVLGVDIFIMNNNGQVLLKSVGNGGKGRSAKKILMSILGNRFSRGEKVVEIFKDRGDVLEYHMACGLYVFAIPVNILDGFLVFGPLALTKRPSGDDCIRAEAVSGFSKEDVFDMIHQVRVMSFVMVRAVVDLFKEMVSWFSEMSSPINVAEDDADDSVLEKVLAAALRLTGASSGSIMLADKDSKYLEVRVVKGVGNEGALGSRAHIASSVSGAVFGRNQACLFEGREGDEEIRPFLRRSDIKQSLVMPLTAKGRAFGVMNLNADDRAPVDFSKKLSCLSGLTEIFS